MTEKELSYIEDATMHEDNIIKIINESLNYLTDENLISFMNEEVTIHKNMKEVLLNTLGEKVNE